MSESMVGRNGLVTGAASGIGRGAAIELAKLGARVVVSDVERSRSGGEETVALVAQAGGEATFVACDVRSEADQVALVASVVDTYGRLDFAVNNAGVLPGFHPFADVPDADWDFVLDVNLKGVFVGMQAQIAQMVIQGGGAIVNTASVAGVVAIKHLCHYTASKHGVIGLTKTAALDYGEQGIRVNCVLPNGIRTGMMGEAPPDVVEKVIAPQAIKRVGEPEEVGAAIAFLCSDKASFITGISLPVDGGFLVGT